MKEQTADPGPILFVEEGGQLRLLEKSVEQLVEEKDEPKRTTGSDPHRSLFDNPRVRVR
jgi:hypothetical protein